MLEPSCAAKALSATAPDEASALRNRFAVPDVSVPMKAPDSSTPPVAQKLWSGLSLPRPFQDIYSISLITAVLSLVPYIMVTSAYSLYRKEVSRDISAGVTGLEIINGLGLAGYAFGALFGGDIINRFKQRRLFLLCEGMFIVGCLLGAIAGNIVTYGAGRVMQGFATGLLLVVALPPVIQQFPANKMPYTAATIDIGFFGAVTAGPLLGGAAAYGHAWRWFYGGLGLIGCLTFTLAILTLPDKDPQNPDLRFDLTGIVLGLGATALPFWGVGELTGNGFTSFFFMVPLTVGLACFVTLLVVEYHKEEPLSPVKQMWHTFPIIGTLTAMVGGATFVTFVTLGQQLLRDVAGWSPLATGLVFWPQVVGAVITAAVLGLLLRTRFLPILIVAGMLCLLGGGGFLLLLPPSAGTRATMLGAAALLGLGAGATVSPGLYLAGFSLPSKQVGRIFALVELVRSVADFILAPIMVQIARVASGAHHPTAAGIREAIWITMYITIALTIGGVALYLLGGAGLPRPDLEGWIEKNRPAIGSPKLVQALTGGET